MKSTALKIINGHKSITTVFSYLKLTKGIIGKSCSDSVDSFLTIFSIYSINHISAMDSALSLGIWK